MRTRMTPAAFAAVLASGAAAFAGPTVYAPNSLYTTNGNMDDLIMFDAADPAGYVVIGPMGRPNVGFGGMDFDADGNLYAYASFFHSTGGAASGLYSVDLATGQATPIGNSPQSLEDLAFNPADGKMYGVRSQNNVTRLYTVNLQTGVVSLTGVLTGLPQIQRSMGLAFDSQGVLYLHDMDADKIYKADGLALTELYTIPQDTNYSQGMTIDWSNDDTGYHAAVGLGEYPNYFSQMNTFAIDGSGYVLGDPFGPQIDGGDGFFYPPVECGDLAIMPGSGGCNGADMAEPFGSLDFFDVSAFLAAYNAGDQSADLLDDDVLNFFDVSEFLAQYNAGCP